MVWPFVTDKEKSAAGESAAHAYRERKKRLPPEFQLDGDRVYLWPPVWRVVDTPRDLRIVPSAVWLAVVGGVSLLVLGAALIVGGRMLDMTGWAVLAVLLAGGGAAYLFIDQYVPEAKEGPWLVWDKVTGVIHLPRLERTLPAARASAWHVVEGMAPHPVFGRWRRTELNLLASDPEDPKAVIRHPLVGGRVGPAAGRLSAVTGVPLRVMRSHAHAAADRAERDRERERRRDREAGR